MQSQQCSHNHKHDHGPGHDHHIDYNPENIAFKRALYFALFLNFTMFMVEIYYGFLSHSLALRADALDFLGDSANYFVTLFVLNSALKTKARVSVVKAIFMLVVGLWIFGETLYRIFYENVPDPKTMGWIGFFALVANVLSALVLFRFREGDSNMKSIWLCSRNDAIGNVAVMIASGFVYYFNSQWPDIIVAMFMAYLAIVASFQIMKLASEELRSEATKKYKLKKKDKSHTHHH